MNRTIAAISTAVSESGIGIVRISGPDAFSIAFKIFYPADKRKRMEDVPSHTIHYGIIKDQEKTIDEVLLMVMRGPRTYTGEDTIEIDCHGGILSMSQVLETVLKNGAQMAEPGEFTKKAFLNGRIDLSQAEAVMDVIRSKNENALQNSLAQLKGSVKDAVQDIRNKLIHEIAYIEAALDDPEHFDLDEYSDQLLSVIEKEQAKIAGLISSFQDGKILREGCKTVILGKPNTGKSSVLNVLVGEEKAIVTDIAGTTRDLLEEYVNLKGITLKIIDTAGIRNTEDPVEKIGVDRARKKAEEADLILYVIDSSVPLDSNDEAIMHSLDPKKTIILYNKTDLNPQVDPEKLKKSTHFPICFISAKQKNGFEELSDLIYQMFSQGKIHQEEEVLITNLRHKEALQEAYESLSLVIKSIHDGLPEDFYSIDLTNACDDLGKITGESVGEDIVNEIFRSFCVGK